MAVIDIFSKPIFDGLRSCQLHGNLFKQFVSVPSSENQNPSFVDRSLKITEHLVSNWGEVSSFEPDTKRASLSSLLRSAQARCMMMMYMVLKQGS